MTDIVQYSKYTASTKPKQHGKTYPNIQTNKHESTMMRLSNNRTATLVLVVSIVLACLSLETESFSSSSSLSRLVQRQNTAFDGKQPSLVIVRDTTEESPSSSIEGDSASAEPTEKISLEDKMKSWEATEEELRAASLGGIIPTPQGRERTEAFDVGLYIAFPIMVLTGLAFAFFPFIMGNIDVSDIVVPTE